VAARREFRSGAFVPWDNAGWTLLGERTINGKRDRDTIKVDRDEGRFTKLTVVVLDSDLEMINMDLRFGNGESFSPPLAQVFVENSRTRVIDLPGNERAIKSIDFRYRNLPGGGKARVQVWAKREAAVPMPSPLPAAQAWDPTGWTLMGEQTVDGARDRDRIRVGRDEGTFRRLIIVVLDSDLDLIAMEVKFGKGRPFAPAVTHAFRENSRTRVIDLPGDQRVIKWIDFRYRNLPGGGRARVQVWAQ
jgi:hypothetical protein